MKRRGCIDCSLIEPTAQQWVGGLCPSCSELRARRAERQAASAPPPAEPKPEKDPALAATAARLQGYLARVADQYPDVWKQVDMLRSFRGGKLPGWPSWCFMPLSGAYAIASGGEENPPPERYADVGVIGCLAAWRPTQGIYRFDETVRVAVWDTPLDGDIPTEILHALPEWCVYVETPGTMYLDAESPGFFAFLEQDTHDTREELRIIIDMHPALSVAVPIHLNRGGLIAGIEAALDEAARQIEEYQLPVTGESRQIMDLPRQMIADALRPRINLLLYLCSTNAEMHERKTGRLRPRKPTLTKTKDGMRMFPADKPAVWDVAYRLGAAIRHAQQQERGRPEGRTHASPRAHVRRAHWHSFWTGHKAKVGVARSEERKLILKWLPPIPVNVDEDAPVVPTVHDVQA